MGANLKEVRLRIKSIQSTQQITKAMKLVAAAKLKKAQDAITGMRPYSQKLNEMLSNIVSAISADELDVTYGKERAVRHALLVIITSNRGLCGAFNSNVSKKAAEAIDTTLREVYEAGNLHVLTIGSKGEAYISKRYPKAHMITDFTDLFSNLTFENTAQVAQHIMQSFENGTFDSVHVTYGRFQNAALQIAECEQFLPVPKVEKEENAPSTSADFIFEPEKVALLNELFPSILKTQFHRFNLETHASEHGARMTAMDSATENAKELEKDLVKEYNKARQEAITKEISEIVGGAAALEGA